MNTSPPRNVVLQGDAETVLRTLPDNCIQCCISSPPYYGLRSYLPDEHPDKALEIGLEETPQAYIERLVRVFEQVRRVLRPDGVLWLNIADSHAHDEKWGGATGGKHANGLHGTSATRLRRVTGLAPKNLLMIPARVALALQADGWVLRSDCIWHKPDALPEPVRDRPTLDYEHVYLLTKQTHYYYDAEVVKEPSVSGHASGNDFKRSARLSFLTTDGTTRGNAQQWLPTATRNRRSVWSLNTAHCRESHFAVMPSSLAEVCLLAGSSPRACEQCGAPWQRVVERGASPPEPAHRHPAKRLAPGQTGNAEDGNMGFRASRLSGQEIAAWRATHPDTTRGWQPTCSCANAGEGRCLVLDPFAGVGTTLLVAVQHQRDYIGIELNEEYVPLCQKRLQAVQQVLWTREADMGADAFDGDQDNECGESENEEVA